jgi:superfamily II DNA/RNA helicase
MLTMSYGKVLRELEKHHGGDKVLFVLSRQMGTAITDVVGALHHFGAQVSTEQFDEQHNVLVTTEDTIRGMDYNVDHVVLVGRPMTPTDYIHICGRTGRAGRPGRIITVCNQLLYQWESMLNIKFQPWRTTEPAAATTTTTTTDRAS